MIAVQVQNLTKTYKLYSKPAHRLFEAILRKPMHKAFSALENISFTVNMGGTLGIIGENGAGKSTLLKILAKTLNPSSGHVWINGKVAALLELGAGFHQEFTGRQNIFLNASLLGLSEKDIKDKEEEIIAFSELQDFIDCPLKSYSSGMVVRLAFSIATCVDPDILIVDEALSVGDVRFQQKCVQKMIKFREAGKTLIFCSHSMYHVNELCSDAIWLERGKVAAMGKTNDVVSDFLNYLDTKNTSFHDQSAVTEDRAIYSEVQIKDVVVINDECGSGLAQGGNRDMVIRIDTKAKMEDFIGHVGAAIFNPEEQMVFGTSTKHSEHPPIVFVKDQCFEVRFQSVPIKRGSFKIRAYILDKEGLRIVDEFTTKPYQFSSDRPDLGYLWIEHQWKRMG